MKTGPYRLSLIVRVAGSDAGPTQETMVIAAETAKEAIGIARAHITHDASEAWCSATLTDGLGKVIWWMREWKREDGDLDAQQLHVASA